jgi:hypothetical protein
MTVDLMVLIAAVGLVGGAGLLSLVAYVRNRGPRVVVCAIDGRRAAVAVDAAHAARAVVTGNPLRVADCSFWPGRARCGQVCLDPAGPPPLARGVRLLARWYAGRRCALCGGAFGEPQWCQYPPALVDAQGRSAAWFELTPDQVSAGLAGGGYQPLCWRCHVLETLRRAEAPA